MELRRIARRLEAAVARDAFKAAEDRYREDLRKVLAQLAGRFDGDFDHLGIKCTGIEMLHDGQIAFHVPEVGEAVRRLAEGADPPLPEDEATDLLQDRMETWAKEIGIIGPSATVVRGTGQVSGLGGTGETWSVTYGTMPGRGR